MWLKPGAGSNLDEKTAFILLRTMMDMACKLGEEVLYNMVCKFSWISAGIIKLKTPERY